MRNQEPSENKSDLQLDGSLKKHLSYILHYLLQIIHITGVIPLNHIPFF